MKKAKTRREIEHLTVVVKLDTGTPGAIYVQLRQGLKIAKTVVRQQWPLVAVDLAADGRVVGLEAVGHESFTLAALFSVAGIRAPARLMQDARFETGVAA